MRTQNHHVHPKIILVALKAYQAVVINCVHKQSRSELIARDPPSDSPERAGWLGPGKRYLVSNSNTKDDPSGPVHGPKRASKGHNLEGLGGPLEAPWKPLCRAGPRY